MDFYELFGFRAGEDKAEEVKAEEEVKVKTEAEDK